MRLGVRQKLVLLSIAVLIVISFGFTALSLSLSRGWVEEDLKDRAIAFAQEIAATIGDQHEFESGALLQDQVRQILAIRQNVSQLDILAFEGDGARVLATTRPASVWPKQACGWRERYAPAGPCARRPRCRAVEANRYRFPSRERTPRARL